MPDATTPAPATPEVVDVSLDSIVGEALKAAADSGVEVMDGQPPKPEAEAPAADAPVPAEAPAETPEAAPAADPAPDPEPSAAEARRILAAAERTKAEATQMVERATAELLSGLKKNPKATLAKLGMTVDDVIDASLDEGDAPAPAKPAPETDLDRRVKALEEREQRLAIDTRKAEIRRDIAADKRFVAINAAGETETVLGFMESYFAKHGQPIPWAKAAQMVEDQLRGSATKVSKALGAFSATPAPAPAARPGTQTLTNDTVRNSPPSADEDPTRDMSPDRAIAYLVEHAS
jgi:hypothetical protein